MVEGESETLREIELRNAHVVALESNASVAGAQHAAPLQLFRHSWRGVVNDYSYRSETIGSTREARLAGM